MAGAACLVMAGCFEAVPAGAVLPDWFWWWLCAWAVGTAIGIGIALIIG